MVAPDRSTKKNLWNPHLAQTRSPWDLLRGSVTHDYSRAPRGALQKAVLRDEPVQHSEPHAGIVDLEHVLLDR
jgi:hypothetical protein